MFTPSMADMISACPRRAMDAHSNTCIFIFIQMHLSIVVGQFTQINQECQDPSACYTLYRGSATWSQAASYCQSINQRLAVIPDQDTQDVISRFAGSGTGDDQLAWVGGRRGRGTPWRDVNDKLIGSSTIREVAGSGQWCSGVRVTFSTGDDGLYDLPCQGSYRALCQLPSTSRCEAPRYNISRVCHVVSGSIFTSWESARAHCSTVYGGKLAFSVISTGRVFYPNYPDDTYFWVGFHRRAWVWSSIQALLTYTNWLPSDGVGELDECLVVDLTRNGSWTDTGCNVTHEYYICEGTPTINPTTSAIDSTILLSSPQTTGRSEVSTLLRNSPSDTLSDSSTTTSVGTADTKKVPVLYIIGGCVGGVVVLVLIVVIALCVKRRRRKSRQTSGEESGVKSYKSPVIGKTETTSSTIEPDQTKSVNLNGSKRSDDQPDLDYLKPTDVTNLDVRGAHRVPVITNTKVTDKVVMQTDPLYDEAVAVRKRHLDTADSGTQSAKGANGPDPVYDDPAQVQLARLSNVKETVPTESGSRDSDLEITDNPLYAPK